MLQRAGHMGERVTKAIWLMSSKPVTAARKIHLGAEPKCLLSLELILTILLILQLSPLQSPTAAVPNLSGTKDRFCGRQFFHGPGDGGWFRQ